MIDYCHRSAYNKQSQGDNTMSAERGDRSRKREKASSSERQTRRPMVTGGGFREKSDEGLINLPPIIRYRGRRERTATSEPTLDDTIKILTTLERIKKLQESGSLTDEDAEKFRAQAMEAIDGTQKNDDKAFVGMLPATLRGLRKGYQWTAEKAIKKIEEHAEKKEAEEEVDDPNKSKLTDPEWDDKLWKGNNFNRSPSLSESGMADPEWIMNPNPSTWRFGGDVWIKKPTVDLPDDSLPSQRKIHEKEVSEAKAPDEPVTIRGSASDSLPDLMAQNPDLEASEILSALMHAKAKGSDSLS